MQIIYKRPTTFAMSPT